MTWLTGWNYRKSVSVSNTGSTLTDYQVSITVDTASLVSSGKLLSNCNDIRFTDTDGSILLNYWIESGCNTVSTKIWIKVPSIPNGTKTIYLYYNNPSAVSASNGTNTFEFFDDFDGSSVDTNKWTVGGTPSVSGSILTLINNSSLLSKTGFGVSIAERARHRLPTARGGSNGGYGGEIGFFSAAATRAIINSYAGTGWYASTDGTIGTSMGIGYDTSFHIYEVKRLSTGVNQFRIDSIGIDLSRSDTMPALIIGYPSIGNETDWFLVRKYVSPEPTFSITGIEETSTASLDISSIPSGANIYIDNVLQVGITTPAIITGLSSGTHSYKLTLAGYADSTGTFTITAGSTTTLSVTFAPSASFASSPPGARIWIDGTNTGANTPGTITGITAGSRNYTLKLSGYIDYTGSFTATSGTTTVVPTATLTLATGGLDISSIPSGSEIFIDNVDQLVTTPAIITNLSVGTHSYKLTLSGYADSTGTFSITAGSTTTLSVTFAPSASFTSTPSGAEVFIDNVDQLVTTPHVITGLTPGSRGYKLTLSGYADVTGTFTATSGSTTTISVTMLTPANITATNMTITKSKTPCIVGDCTVTIAVTWTNTGQTSGTFIPNIKIDNIAISPPPYPSEPLAGGASITHSFAVSDLAAATHTICPYPN